MSAKAPGKESASMMESPGVRQPAASLQDFVLFAPTYRKLVNGIVAMFVKGLEPYAARNNLVFTHYGINSNPADLL